MNYAPKCYNIMCKHYDEEEKSHCAEYGDFFCVEFIPSKYDAVVEAIEQIKDACDSILKLVEEMKED